MIDSQIMRLLLESMLVTFAFSILLCWLWTKVANKLVDFFFQALDNVLDKLPKEKIVAILKKTIGRKSLKKQ